MQSNRYSRIALALLSLVCALTCAQAFAASQLTLSSDSVMAGETVECTFTDDVKGDLTAVARFSIQAGARGAWNVGGAGANVYTSEKAGTWRVSARYGTRSAVATLQVTPNDELPISRIKLSPARSYIHINDILTLETKVYDHFGNLIDVMPTYEDWEWEDGSLFGEFNDNCQFMPFWIGTDRLRCWLGETSSNWVEVLVAFPFFDGPYLAWDKDTQSFFLCMNPMNPETGIEITESGWYDCWGVNVYVGLLRRSRTDVTAAILNCMEPNYLRVQHYMRSGELFRAYMYSTIGDGPTQKWVYNAGYSYPSPTHGWINVFIAPTHYLGAVSGGYGLAGLSGLGEVGANDYDPQTGTFDEVICKPVPQSEDDNNGGWNPYPQY